MAIIAMNEPELVALILIAERESAGVNRNVGNSRGWLVG
jgi:hypothetical protein